jgi:hypothetical protein
MTDYTRTDDTTPGVFDDDRLLALALGLDADPELIAAAADDDALGRRLSAMRAEVAGIDAQVRAAVPAPDDDYTDLADPRWAGLHEFFAAEAPRPAGARGRASRWLRVLAPTAAVIVALAVGVTVLERQGDGTASLQSDKAATEATAPVPAPSGRGADSALSLADQVDQFALVVLAKARAAKGAVQRFTVVRVLKGKAPDVLRLRIADAAAPAGRLHLLLLRPLADLGAEALNVGGLSTTKSGLDDYGAGKPVAYSYLGEPAVARELPPGTDPDTITLP